MDVNGERLDGDGIEAADPGRHHAAAAGPNALHDSLLTAAVEPDIIRQIGGALVLVSLAVEPVAARALIGEHFLAAARRRRIGRLARERQDVLRGIRDLSVLECAAPEPIIVIKIWITNKALGATAVTGRTVGMECGRAAGHGEAQEVWLAFDLIERSCGKLLAQAALRGPHRLEFVGDSGALAVAEHALGVADERRKGRIDQPVSNGPDDRGIESQEPPPRQRLIELLDAVPLVPRRLGACHRIDVVLLDGHLRPLSTEHPCCRSSARRCASSKRGLLPGQSAYTTTARNMATNIRSDTTW